MQSRCSRSWEIRVESSRKQSTRSGNIYGPQGKCEVKLQNDKVARVERHDKGILKGLCRE